MTNLKDKVIFITGASRGIGHAIAMRCARDGAKIVVAAKTSAPHSTLQGTIHSVAKEIEEAGGQALAVEVDVRDESKVSQAVSETVSKFGGIDILINNASAINMSGTESITMKRFDLLMQVNMRATFMCSKYCIPHLKKSSNPHILNLSPPLNLDPKWFKDHLAYTMSKYGMSMCTLGLSKEFAKEGIAVNSLWPKTIIATVAIEVNFPKELYQATRKPEIVADAAYFIINSNSREVTGNFFIDEEVILKHGIKDLNAYALHPNSRLYPDLFLG